MRSRIRGGGLFATLLLSAGCASGTGVPRESAVFYPPPPEAPRFQLLGTFSTEKDMGVSGGLADVLLGSPSEEEALVGRAYGLAWHEGCLYVCDPGRAQVAVLDFALREVRALDPERRAPLSKPIDIAIAPGGEKYVTDTGLGRVMVYDGENRYVRAFGEPSGWRPTGIALHGERLYVTDVEGHAVRVLDRSTGVEIGRFGGRGAAPGQFHFPVAVATGPDGDVFVSDSFNFRVQRLRPDGTPVAAIGSAGKGPGQFTRPKGIAVDGEERVFVLDAAFENVQVFDGEGKLLLYWGGAGSRPGDMNLPSGVCVSYEAVPSMEHRVAEGFGLEYVLFITNQSGPFKVTAYGFLSPR